MFDPSRQQKARKPNKADVKHGDAQIGKVALAEPHEANAEQQGIKTVEPPQFVLMATEPSERRPTPR
jgi:hypothetical protein